MVRLLIIFFLLGTFAFSDNNSNDNCSQQELIPQLHGISTPTSFQKTGTVSSSDTHDYYYFSPGIAGRLTLNYTSTARTDLRFFVGTCSTTNTNNRVMSNNTSYSGSINVGPNDTVRVVVRQRAGSPSYNLNFSFFPNITEVGERNFALRNPPQSRNIRGNSVFIGNTVLCPLNDCDYAGTLSNADLNLRFINTDNYNGTYANSSRARLSIPSTAVIRWAGLYTQGYLSGGTTQAQARTILDTEPDVLIVHNTNTTLNLLPEVADIVAYSTFGFTYQAYRRVSYLEGMTGQQVNGWISAANVKAREGRSFDNNDGLGNFGAWTLVVVYEDPNESLKNISVFDGYRRVGAGTPVNIAVSGFLTPSNPPINSTLSVFAGEGDRNIAGDTMSINGNDISIVQNNAFNSSITGVTRQPSITNNQGIDIQNIDVSAHVGASAQSATIGLTSTQDVYFPSVVAFTTELYEPRVCYFIDTIRQADSNTTIFEDRSFVGEIDPAQEYTFHIWISNMKKSPTDTTLETAELVQVYMDMIDIDYTPGSMLMRNFGASAPIESLTDATSDDEGEFVATSNQLVWRVGSGASSTQGGTIAPAANFSDDSKKAFITYRGKFDISSDATSVDLVDFFKFKSSFKTDSITIGSDNAQYIEQCQDLNTSAVVVSPPQGLFNVVNENFSGSSLNNEADTALFTQVSGQSFNVKIVALENDFKTLKNHTGEVTLSLIQTPNFTGDPTGDQNLCDGTSPISSQTLTFAGEKTKTQSLSISQPMQSASFKVSFTDATSTRHVCSTDSFAIRPASYNFAITPTPLIGGKQHTVTTTALDSSDAVISSGYTHIGGDVARQHIELIIPAGCAGVAAESASQDITFGGGIDSSIVQTGNIGDYILTVTDSTWAKVDINVNGTRNDCIAGSASNTPVGGKVGCNVEKSETFYFSPKDFSNSLQISNFNGDSFTYISSDSQMRATASATITARLANNTTATAYSAGCYANSINSTVSLISEPDANEWKSNPSNATQRIRFFEDQLTTSESPSGVGQATFATGEGNFTSGVANITVHFNLTKDNSIPDEPFRIFRNDLNISVVDAISGVNGDDFNRTNDHNVAFYYGRVHAPDYRGVSPIDARIGYEVYCRDCNRTAFGIGGPSSPSSNHWFINTSHTTIAQGANSAFSSKGGTTTFDKAQTQAGEIAIGVEQLVLTATTTPSVDRIELTPSPWLVFNPFNGAATTTDFMVEFLSGGTWGGGGTVDKDGTDIIGKHVDNQNVSTRTNRRISW